MTKPIYIGESKGSHWAAKSDREVPHLYSEWLQSKDRTQYVEAFDDFCRGFHNYLASLPRILCSPELVQGLKPGDELPQCREQKQWYSPRSNMWTNCTDDDYTGCVDKYRRSILVPVEAKQEQECAHEGLIDTGIGYYHCQQCDKAWTYEEWDKSTTPQEQGEDELWLIVSKELGYDSDEIPDTIKELKSKYTISRK